MYSSTHINSNTTTFHLMMVTSSSCLYAISDTGDLRSYVHTSEINFHAGKTSHPCCCSTATVELAEGTGISAFSNQIPCKSVLELTFYLLVDLRHPEQIYFSKSSELDFTPAFRSANPIAVFSDSRLRRSSFRCGRVRSFPLGLILRFSRATEP